MPPGHPVCRTAAAPQHARVAQRCSFRVGLLARRRRRIVLRHWYWRRGGRIRSLPRNVSRRLALLILVVLDPVIDCAFLRLVRGVLLRNREIGGAQCGQDGRDYKSFLLMHA